MPKYKRIFKKNINSMILLILFIGISLFIINQIASKKNYPKENIGGSFKLIDQNGEVFNSKDFNKKKLIYFGYTYCPDICPFDLLKISTIFKNDKRIRENIMPLFITVDPSRDTIDVIRDFLNNFDNSLTGLTGSEEEIKKIIKKFKIYVKLNKAGRDDVDYLVDHSSLIFLLNEKDQYLTFLRPAELNQDSFNKYLENAF